MTATATTRKTKPRAKPTYPPFPSEDDAFVRLPQILKVLPVGRTTWFDGIKEGRFPKPTKMGKASMWRAGDIRRVLSTIASTSMGSGFP